MSANSVSSPVSLTLFGLPPLVRAKVSQPHTGVQVSVRPELGTCLPSPKLSSCRCCLSFPLATSGVTLLAPVLTVKWSLFTVCLGSSLLQHPRPSGRQGLSSPAFVIQCASSTVPSCSMAPPSLEEDQVLLICCLSALLDTPSPRPFCFVGFPLFSQGFPFFPGTSAPTYPITVSTLKGK